MARTTASRRSTHSNRFSNVPSVRLPRASFDRTKTHKDTIDSGFLYPVYWEEIYPGDSVIMDPVIFGRVATLINPIMDNLWLDVFWFFTQNRLLDDNWVKLMGEQDKPGDSIDFTVPQLVHQSTSATGFKNLADRFGIPPDASNGGDISVNAYPFRAYNRIWNEWFRDQNLQDSLNSPTDAGPDNVNFYVLQKRGKRHDYFTSCLPWPQKGDSVSVPIGTRAPIFADPGAAGNAVTVGDATQTQQQTLNASAANLTFNAPSGSYPGQLFADLSTATAATINQLRQAFQVQRLLERDARGGTRYPELLQSHFGVRDPSLAVLQRPVYLGGGTIPINITPIAQTSETQSGSQTPQANLAGMGTMSGGNIGFRGSFTEHGILMCLVMIRADLTYQQGIRREFFRSTRYDYYWPVLAHLGEQAVQNREIFADGTATDTETFGYQERHAELRYSPNTIAGKFRSKATGTLDPWHLSQNFASRPALNSSFIEEDPPVARVIAAQNEPQFLIDCMFKTRWVRPMPMYGVPGLIDHF